MRSPVFSMFSCLIGALAILCGPRAYGASSGEVWMAPAGERYAEQNLEGETVLPNGRIISPVGPLFRVRPHPYGLTLSRDGRYVVVVSSDDPQLTVLDLKNPDRPDIYYIPDDTQSGKGVLDSAFMGLAVAPDNRTLYVAGADDWSVFVFDLETRERIARIGCEHQSEGKQYNFGYVGDIHLSPDGKYLYALDQSNWRFLVIDTEKRSVVTSIGVGRFPFGLGLSQDGKYAFIANVGMFEYSYMKTKEGKPAKLPYPPFGLPSPEAEKGVEIDDVVVPGLGDPNDIRGMSVWTINLRKPTKPKVVSKVKSGHLVGEQLEDFPAVGGSSPNSVAVTHTHVYVSNGSNDSITVINRKTRKREPDIDLYLGEPFKKYRGMIPFGLAVSPEEKTLYVALAGINAVGVIDLDTRTVLGYIPTAWFPSKLAVSPDGKRLYVSCAKGLGSGPNAGPKHRPGDPTGVGDLMRGYVHIITLPTDTKEYVALTQKVVDNNVRRVPLAEVGRPQGHPVPPLNGLWKSPIKYVVYVTKENRTFDEVFGALPGVKGDAELCRLGRPIEVSNRDGSRVVKDVVLMPNHIALAKRFAINDNFYCDSDHSTDGHRWLVGTYPNEFMEARIGSEAGGDGPGNFLFTGSSGAVYPEDYNEAGAIWEHFERNKIRFYNFGLGFEFKPADEQQHYTDTGIRLTINYPMPKPAFENTSRRYPTYNTNIPDVFRMEQFEHEFKERWASGKEPFPQVITIMLPNDHGASERPQDGYPFWGSYMSDNDLALGRLVEILSHSKYWKEMVIFVTEDDAQGYRDTVDAHRSICMVISPYAKRGYVSHVHSSFGSILKTMFLILDIPYLNQYDAFSTDLADMFTLTPDNAEPYSPVPVHPEIFDPQKAYDPYDKEFKWEDVMKFVPLDDQRFLDTDEYGHAGPLGHGPRVPAKSE
jgi:YVTN family beta-propeller protein